MPRTPSTTNDSALSPAWTRTPTRCRTRGVAGIADAGLIVAMTARVAMLPRFVLV
ncbi:hypothetical protein BURPS1710A_1048 [Burkholderia pseudomallei 1710a]|uniref:Uncharacterized protein n=1 Tax=Burkholderia pseudomallei 1710a TaxID=320371 RepID=A0A0E1W116_BURPE|nr:hypothetical protein BURPS1710A_1048 [Burkholderia pseudomallei 1710a]